MIPSRTKCTQAISSTVIVLLAVGSATRLPAQATSASPYRSGDSIAAQISTDYDEVRDSTTVTSDPMAVGFGVHMVAGATFTGRRPARPAAGLIITFAIESTTLEHENEHSVVFMSPYGRRLRPPSRYLRPRFVSNGVIEYVVVVLTMAQAHQLVAGENAMGEIGRTDITIGSGQMKVIAEILRRIAPKR